MKCFSDTAPAGFSGVPRLISEDFNVADSAADRVADPAASRVPATNALLPLFSGL